MEKSLKGAVDLFIDNPNPLFGKKLHEQVEDRLSYYDTGDAPKKNIDVMREVIEELSKTADEGSNEQAEKKKKKKKKKGKTEEEGKVEEEIKVEDAGENEESKDKKKKKKRKEKGD